MIVLTDDQARALADLMAEHRAETAAVTADDHAAIRVLMWRDDEEFEIGQGTISVAGTVRFDRIDRSVCPECGGQGEVTYMRPRQHDEADVLPCETCLGSGTAREVEDRAGRVLHAADTLSSTLHRLERVLGTEEAGR